MKKYIMTMFASLMMILCTVSAFAANSDFIGTFDATDAGSNGYAVLNITSCSDTDISVTFRRSKNNIETFTYVFDQGKMNGTSGSFAFKATNQAGTVLSGTATINLRNDGMVNLKCVSSQGQIFYEGIMKRTSNPSLITSNDNSTTQATQTSSSSTDVQITLNGTKLQFDNTAKPYIVNNSTYVPLRSVLNKMGINVYWDQYQKNDAFTEQLITCTKNMTILQFARTLNSSGANSWTLSKWENRATDDAAAALPVDIRDLQPLIINSKSYIPLRVISESFGATVDWDNGTRTVIINCDTNNQYAYNSTVIAGIEDFSANLSRTYITADFTSIYGNGIPYFTPQSKFYLYNANDQWGEVVLRVFYGGYIDAYRKDAYEEGTV